MPSTDIKQAALRLQLSALTNRDEFRQYLEIGCDWRKFSTK